MVTLRLRPLIASDTETLRSWAEREDMVEYFRRFPPLHQWPASPDALLQWFPGTAAVLEGEELAGVVQVFNVDMQNRRAEIGAAIATKGPQGQRRGELANRALRQVVDALFNVSGLERVYCIMLEHRTAAHELLKANGFKVDGILRNNAFFQGEFRNEVLLSLLKSEYRRL